MSGTIGTARLQALNAGSVSSTHLAECLAVDFAALLQAVAPTLPPASIQRMQAAAGRGITQRMALAAALLREAGQGDVQRRQAHPSDTVRGWACYLIGSDPQAALADKLQAMRPLADDAHFGVREWAWLALRSDIVAERWKRLPCCNPGRCSARRISAASPVRRFAPAVYGPRTLRCSSSNPSTRCPCWRPSLTIPSAMCRTRSATG